MFLTSWPGSQSCFPFLCHIISKLNFGFGLRISQQTLGPCPQCHPPVSSGSTSLQSCCSALCLHAGCIGSAGAQSLLTGLRTQQVLGFLPCSCSSGTHSPVICWLSWCHRSVTSQFCTSCEHTFVMEISHFSCLTLLGTLLHFLHTTNL